MAVCVLLEMNSEMEVGCLRCFVGNASGAEMLVRAVLYATKMAGPLYLCFWHVSSSEGHGFG